MEELPYFWGYRFKQGTVRYMAPEQFDDVYDVDLASKQNDVYSLAMTSFTVCSSSIGKPSDTQYNHPINIRSSQGCFHMMGFVAARL